MTKREYDLAAAERRWEREKSVLERENALKDEKASLKWRKFKKISTSKWLIIFLFLNCTLIELFTGWVTIKTIALCTVTGISPDFTPLVTLIGAVISEVIGYAVYSLKSMKENTAGGIVYENVMAGIDTPPSPPDEANSVG